ncbi:hypothetical protein D3C71_1342100 [compost metagenome]
MSTLVIDFDTILYSSAAQQQVNRCLAIHKESGREKLWDSKTEFNNWLKGQDRWTKEDFDFKVKSELTGEASHAFRTIDQKLANIIEAGKCDDFLIVMEGPGNFRMDRESTFVNYKGSRPEKPLLFHQCKEFIRSKYRHNLLMATGRETDDEVVIRSWQSYNKSLKYLDKDEAHYVIAYCDKDIPANGRGWMLNYFKLEEGIFWNDGFTQSYNFATQCLTGDNADEIPGIEGLSAELKQKYNIRVNGVGPATAVKLLADCKTEQDLANRVVECYRGSHPEDWKQRLDDNAFYLYLMRSEDDKWDAARYFGAAWDE